MVHYTHRGCSSLFNGIRKGLGQVIGLRLSIQVGSLKVITMPAYVPLAGYVVVRLTAELCVGVFNMCTIEHIPKEDLTVPADTLFAEGTRNKPDIAADILEHQAGAKPMHEPKSEEDGKKRKVALYVAYIGAGYAVSLNVKILHVPSCILEETFLPKRRMPRHLIS